MNTNRYNELNESVQRRIDQLVNSMASNRHVGDEVMTETLMNALANIRQLGREAMEVS
jgi:DNA-directed RNA polymerase specialized sigma24 family protein|tara:strand:- start:437 stop:610 length:174 start_codon:yes stop_codon:yes gene_type:complete